MFPSASDYQVRAPFVSDSGIDIGEEVEIEEQMEVEEESEEEDPEEEEEEAEEEEQAEEEEEEAEEVVEEVGEEAEEEEVEAKDSRNSRSEASDFRKDVETDSESKRLVKCLGSSSSMTEKFESCPALNSDGGALKSTTPSDEQSTTLKDLCLSFEISQCKQSREKLTLIEDKETQESCVNENNSEWPTGNSLSKNLSLKSHNRTKRDNTEIVSLGNANICNTTGENIVASVPGMDFIGQKSNAACVPENGQSDVKLEDERSRTISRVRSFSPSCEIKEPQQKRAALVCEFFAKGWCIKGKSCRFLHVKDNSNHTSQQQLKDNTAGSKDIQCNEERGMSGHGERGKASQLKENSEASLHSREEISLSTSSAFQRVLPSTGNMGFVSSLKDTGRERLKQNCGADGLENRSSVTNDGKPSISRNSFVPEYRSSVTSYRATDVASSQRAWTRSLPFSSFHMNGCVSGPQRQLEEGNEFYSCGLLSTLQGTSGYSHWNPEGHTVDKKTNVSSNDWEPSEPFRPSFIIPPSILASCGTLYDPFRDSMDVQDLGDRSLNASFSSKGEHDKKNPHQHREGNSAKSPQSRECSDDKNSSCNQNQYQAAVPEKNSETHGVDFLMAGAEMVATSVVEQNDTMPKKGNASMPARNKDNLKKSKPDAGHDNWRSSDGSSNKKILKANRATLADDMDGEVRSGAGVLKESKAMRHFRTALIDTVKELLKPIWREGRLSKDVHNMIVKRAAEKVIGTAVQFHQVPTDAVSVDQYLSLSRPKIIKLVEGYVEKYHKS